MLCRQVKQFRSVSAFILNTHTEADSQIHTSLHFNCLYTDVLNQKRNTFWWDIFSYIDHMTEISAVIWFWSSLFLPTASSQAPGITRTHLRWDDRIHVSLVIAIFADDDEENKGPALVHLRPSGYTLQSNLRTVQNPNLELKMLTRLCYGKELELLRFTAVSIRSYIHK